MRNSATLLLGVSLLAMACIGASAQQAADTAILFQFGYDRPKDVVVGAKSVEDSADIVGPVAPTDNSYAMKLHPGLWQVIVRSESKKAEMAGLVLLTSCCQKLAVLRPNWRPEANTRSPSALDGKVGLGIQPLTPVAAAEAAKDSSSPEESGSPIVLRITKGWGDSLFADVGVKALEGLPFSFLVTSPYGRARATASEARRHFEDAKPVDVDALNAESVTIDVSPWDFDGDSIDTVVLKRGKDIIKPAKRELKTSTISNKVGASRTVQVGSFTFPIEAFAPASPLTIVLVGSRGNFEWVMTRPELGLLK